MISFQATYFDGRNSKAHEVVVTVTGRKCHIAGQGLDLAGVPLAGCRISPPLGHTPRVINLPDGSLCTTGDLNAVARIEKEYRINRGMRLVKWLESRWRIIACCLVVLVVLVAGFSCYGIPALAERLAFSLPDKVVAELSRRTVAVLDNLKRARSSAGILAAAFPAIQPAAAFLSMRSCTTLATNSRICARYRKRKGSGSPRGTAGRRSNGRRSAGRPT